MPDRLTSRLSGAANQRVSPAESSAANASGLEQRSSRTTQRSGVSSLLSHGRNTRGLPAVSQGAAGAVPRSGGDDRAAEGSAAGQTSERQRSFIERRVDQLRGRQAPTSGSSSRGLLSRIMGQRSSHKKPDQTHINDAVQRWGKIYQPASKGTTAQQHAQAFCTLIIPGDLLGPLQADPASRGLLVFCAGMAFTAEGLEGSSQRRTTGAVQVLRTDLEYLQHSADVELLKGCQQVADEAVDQCGDRISYGATKLHQTVEAHRMVTEHLSPRQVLARLDRAFNQLLIESMAVEIAMEQGIASSDESLEVYYDLATRVAQRGRLLLETTKNTLYSGSYAVNGYASDSDSDDDISNALELIDNKHLNPAYIDYLSDHPAFQNVLRQVFAQEFEGMVQKRNTDQEPYTNTMLDLKRSPQDRKTATANLEQLGQAESQWYRSKASEVVMSDGLSRAD